MNFGLKGRVEFGYSLTIRRGGNPFGRVCRMKPETEAEDGDVSVVIVPVRSEDDLREYLPGDFGEGRFLTRGIVGEGGIDPDFTDSTGGFPLAFEISWFGIVGARGGLEYGPGDLNV